MKNKEEALVENLIKQLSKEITNNQYYVNCCHQVIQQKEKEFKDLERETKEFIEHRRRLIEETKTLISDKKQTISILKKGGRNENRTN